MGLNDRYLIAGSNFGMLNVWDLEVEPHELYIENLLVFYYSESKYLLSIVLF